MFDVNDRSWIAGSIIASSAEAEIDFVLSPAFYPDPNVLDDATAVLLPPATTASADLSYHSSHDVLHNEQALAEHYRAVLKLARQHGHSYNEFEHHLSLRLHFGWKDGGIGFWFNTLEVMEALFDWLSAAVDGEMWSDVEQGWEMIAVRVGSRFHFREGGFDQGGECANVAFPREELLLSIASLRERMSVIVGRLTAEFGEDYWSRYRYDLRTDLT